MLSEGYDRADSERLRSRAWQRALVVSAGPVAGALVVQTLFPRYEWRDPGGANPRAFVRVDRWTGVAELGTFTPDRGWLSEQDQAAIASFERMMRQDAAENPPNEEEVKAPGHRAAGDALDQAVREADQLLEREKERPAKR